MKKVKIYIGLLILFFTMSLVHVIGIIMQESILVYITKPCIIPLLLLIYLVKTASINYWYIIGLILCFIGDVLLLFTGELFFILGLVSFLLAHIFYTKTVYNFLDKIQLKTLIMSTVPYIIIYVLLLMILYPYLGDLLYPVIVYGIVISTLGTLCLYYYVHSKNIDAFFWCIGALIFIISDSILAVNKFYSSSIYLATLVMITYILAQYFICKAMLVKKIT